MRRTFISLLFAILLGALFCILFTSCENFLNNANFKNDLERYIEYANAPKINVKIRLDSSDYGTIYPPSKIVAKGDTFTVELIQNPATVFRYWNITDPTTGQALDSKYFTISNETTSEDLIEKTVTRKMDITINELPPDMEIRPKCYLSTEKTPPEFKKLNVAGTQENAVGGVKLIAANDYDPKNVNAEGSASFNHYAKKANFNDDSSKVAENIHTHHVGSSIWIDLEAYDANSGVDELKIEEKQLRNQNAELISNPHTYETLYSLSQEEWQTSVNKLLNHPFKCPEDGVINILITLYDKSGNKVQKTFDVIKDTVCDLDCNLLVDSSECIMRIADGTESYKLKFHCSISSNRSLLDKVYMIDLNGNEYKDCDLLIFETADSPDFNEQVKQYSRMEYCYDNEGFLEFSKDAIDFELTMFDGVSGYFPYSDFLVDVNDYKDTTVRLTVFDEVGNEVSKEYQTYKSAWFNYVKVNNNKTFKLFWDNEYDYCRPYIVYVDKNGNKTTDSANGDSNGMIYDDSYDQDFFNDNGSLKEGTFYFYCLRQKKNHFYIARGVKPFVIYNGVEDPNEVDLSTCSIPDFTCEADEPQKNTGKRTINVNISQSFTPVNGVSYIIKCEGGDDFICFKEITDFVNKTSFEVPTSNSDNPYHVNMMLMNSSRMESKIDNSKEWVKLLNWDNYPPSVDVAKGYPYQTILFPDRRIIFLEKNEDSDPPRKFDNVGLRTDEDDENYMTIKYFYSDMSDLIEKGIDWNNKKFVKQYRQPAANQTLTPPRIELPFDGTNGTYCYVLLEDNNLNSTEYRFDQETLYKQMPLDDEYNTVPTIVELDETDSWNSGRHFLQLEWKQNYDRLRWNATTWYVDTSDSSNNQWKLIRQLTTDWSNNIYNTKYWLEESGYYDPNVNEPDYEKVKWNIKVKRDSSFNSYSQYSYKYKLDYKTTSYNEYYSFIKTCIWATKKDRKDGGYFDVIYFYPRYIHDPDYYKCYKKIFIPGANGYYGDVNLPCLVHTFYSSVDLGSIQAWLNQGMEVDVHQYGWNGGTTFSYSQPLEKIPQGKYYTTIVHYADGTMENTPVEIQK